MGGCHIHNSLTTWADTICHLLLIKRSTEMALVDGLISFQSLHTVVTAGTGVVAQLAERLLLVLEDLGSNQSLATFIDH